MSGSRSRRRYNLCGTGRSGGGGRGEGLEKRCKAARVSGGATGMLLPSKYACRVFAGMEVTSEHRALGVGGIAGIEESDGPGGEAVVESWLGVCANLLNAASREGACELVKFRVRVNGRWVI